MRSISPVALLLLSCGLAWSAQTLNLLAPPNKWVTNLDKPTSTMTLEPATAKVPLATTIVSKAGPEDYPKLRLTWNKPQNFSAYTRLRLRVRVTCSDPDIRSRHLAIVFYDDSKRHAEMPGHPMWQQVISHNVPVGRWMEYTDWLINIKRGKLLQLDLYLYRETSEPITQKWEFSTVQLEGIGETAQPFDIDVYRKGALAGSAGRPVGQVRTNDGLQLEIGRSGGIERVSDDGLTIGRGNRVASGLMVRDVTTPDAPVMFGGTVTRHGDQVQQSARLKKLGLGLQATYKSDGPYLEVSGKLSDLRGQDRAVTLYLALPVIDGNWKWWDSVSVSRTKSAGGELYYLEPGMAFGLHGMHSKYPLGAISLPGKGGLTLAVRMDEPVVDRIGYNTGLHLFYLAMDFGLAPVKTVSGHSLSVAPFRFLIYRHDPTWGFRSALQRYYNYFPQFFTNRIKRQGGWYVWGDMRAQKGSLAAGFGVHWGPQQSAVKWDNEHGILALLYIEPEFYQETMGDYQQRPTAYQAEVRVHKIAAGDPAELAKYEKLSYAQSYVPGNWVKQHSLAAAVEAVSRATIASVNFEADGQPTVSIGQYPWMGESKWGAIFPCNLDPDIPHGKGWFDRYLYIEPGLKEVLSTGGRYNGIGLDSFGGYGQFSRANYRRDQFKYTNTPLTFSAVDHVPVLAMPFSTVEWVRQLATDMHRRGLVLMANCSWGTTPGWLTFAAPYLDVLGAESPRFADPDFARAIARHKLCTDLPYHPVPDWQLQRNQLWDIFPGDGNKPQYMAKFAATFRNLATAGWDPVTDARAAPATVKMERYGDYLVLHNPGQAALQARVRVDVSGLGLKSLQAIRVPNGQKVQEQSGRLVVPLAAQGTEVIKLQ